MYVDGQKISAKILDANEAKRIYQDIVAKRRDPALLEYIGQGCSASQCLSDSAQRRETDST